MAGFVSGKCPVFVLLLFLSGIIFGQSPAEIRITGTFSGPFIQVLNQLEDQYPVKFYFKDSWFSNDNVIVTFRNHTVEEAVNMLVTGKPYTFRIINNKVVFFPRVEAAMLLGQMPYYSNLESEEQFAVVGDLSEVGKHKNVSVTGKVTDGESGEPVIGATIQIQNLQHGIVTNTQGIYKLLLTPGFYTLIVSSVGYETSLFNIKVLSTGEYNIELFDKSVRFEDIVIYGQRMDRNVTSHQMSLVELNIREIVQLPSVSGSKDVIKGLTIMPGIKSIGEFSSGINVRGGGEDQNLYLLNSAPLFYTSHVFGLISVVNPDALDKLLLYKGHIPAAFGERVSSVIDIRSSEKVPEKLTLKGGAGIYDSRLMIEVPVIKDRFWFHIGGRSSYSDWILKNMKEYYLRTSKAGFFDINGAIHLNLGKNRLMLSGYGSNDYFTFSSDLKYDYEIMAGSLNWNYLFSPHLASYFTLTFSDYKVNKDDIGKRQSRISSGIQYEGIKYRLQYSRIAKHNLDAGFSLARYQIMPGKKGPLNERILIDRSVLENEQGIEGAVFINDEFSLRNSLLFNIGLRYSAYGNAAPGNVWLYEPGLPKDTSTIIGFEKYDNGFIKIYHGFEPRLSARLKLNDVSSLKISYNRNNQYISMITRSNVSTPADIWKLADKYIRPLAASQFALGYYRNFYNNTIETSVEAYYKELKNVIEYINGADLEMNSHIETELINATGKNYGIEFLIRKKSGRFDGWLSYTYSRSLRKTDGLTSNEIVNHNRYYPSSYDRPHDFGVVCNFNQNKRVRFSANFTYSTGRPITLPEYYFFNETDRPWLKGRDEVPVFSDRNKYRLEPYHRLDFTLTIGESLRLKKKWKGTWTFALLNVYGRKNPYTVYYKMEEPGEINNYQRYSLYKLYLIGLPVPSVTYNFVF
ncbi:MAG TPA: carboxypeptidase-like regulatory domain-containing protein [Bacteroidales bacterium]|jgi:hypothetical protein|nr:carboxypeptidase-like regulatory domain-containing protein [Bacteroidales bacterium]